MSDAELIVVGGGPVGLATAIEARRAGIDALVVEPREGVIDKACGEGIMPGAIPALSRLGVARTHGSPIAGIDYRDPRRSVSHRFAGGPGLGMRRTVLHAALLERAAELGVRWRHARVTRVDAGGDLATVWTDDDATVRADWLVAADGLHSPVARSVGLALPELRARRRFGQRRHFGVAPWTDLVEVYWTPAGELYVTPLAGEVGVALLAPRGVRFADALAASGELAERLDGADATSELRGAGPFRQRTRARSRGRVLLAGDASGYVDALTAEGLRIGFDQARLAVEAIRAGDPAGYERAWAHSTRDFRVLTSRLVRVASSPLRGAVVPTAATLPGRFAAAVERIAR
ncbi:NAD(P)/FAD-dependent oxidoreductase [Homoserinibacter sp. GY 40078]|uniref:NAD(P)/FAD-dependent oxidoreductase n=1 Tax=Homoserinibacter sp. GY 40078 TaxID=2603275 RepID=UPI0011CC70A8|nr:NAD(P)/FAD-dependent oxidoreductase [Homoserinibacter sp. GY 40078]TXK18846.1 NAD(P)/FAD-dependent oxidoreductase [Homoserinibacter sp. GY 40078]